MQDKPVWVFEPFRLDVGAELFWGGTEGLRLTPGTQPGAGAGGGGA